MKSNQGNLDKFDELLCRARKLGNDIQHFKDDIIYQQEIVFRIASKHFNQVIDDSEKLRELLQNLTVYERSLFQFKLLRELFPDD
mgnify:CR=1 FL=1